MYSKTYTFSQDFRCKDNITRAEFMICDQSGSGFIPYTEPSGQGIDRFKKYAGWHPYPQAEQSRDKTMLLAAEDGVELHEEGIPLRFRATVPKSGIYNVTIVINGGVDGISQMNLYSGRRNLAKRDISLAPGECFTYQYKVHVGDYIAVVGQPPRSDLFIYITAIGSSARLSEVSIEESDAPTLFLGGDSIVADYDAQYPYNPLIAGGAWGQHLLQYFTGVAVDNQAHGGMTTNCFREDGHWEIISQCIKPRDVFMFQFGHNDQKRRNLAAFTGYSTNLRWYIQQVRRKGAIPVIVTSLSRIPSKDDQGWYDLLEDHAEACRRVGRECGVPVIDLHRHSFGLFCQMGSESLKGYFNDAAHSNDYGAILMAEFIASEIKRQHIEPLCWHMNDTVPVPWIPDESLRPPKQEISPLDVPETPILPTDLPELPYVDCVGIKELDGLKEAMLNNLLDPMLKYFHPYADMPRGQFVFIFLKAAPYPKRSYQGQYCDLSKYEFDAPNVQALIDGGLIDEATTLEDRFRPDDALTGGELISFIIRHLYRGDGRNYSMENCEKVALSMGLLWEDYECHKKVNRAECVIALVRMLKVTVNEQ